MSTDQIILVDYTSDWIDEFINKRNAYTYSKVKIIWEIIYIFRYP